jgi:hypothetical protein
MNKMPTKIKNISLIVASIVFSVLIIESALWIFSISPYPERPFSGNKPDNEIGFTLRNSSSTRNSSWEYDTIVNVNNAGFRDSRNITKEFKPDIFVLGDSFTQGHGVNVEDSLPLKLQSEMSNTSVVNLGVNAYSTIQAVVRFKRYIDYFSFKPSDVVLVFYVGNDYYDNRRYMDHLDSTGKQIQTSSNGFVVPDGVTASIIEGSLVWTLNENGKVIYDGPYGGFYPPQGYDNILLDWSKLYNVWAWLNTPRKVNCQIPIAIPGLLDVNYDFNNSREWSLTKKALSDFVAIAESNNITPHIVIMPSKYQLNTKLLVDAGCSIETIDLETSVNFIEKFSDNNNVQSINLLKKFRELSNSEQGRLYFKADSHLTPYGNSITAKIIAKELK